MEKFDSWFCSRWILGIILKYALIVGTFLMTFIVFGVLMKMGHPWQALLISGAVLCTGMSGVSWFSVRYALYCLPEVLNFEPPKEE